MTVLERTLDRDEQEYWVDVVRGVIKSAPLVRPQTPNGMPMRVRVTAAGAWGWVGDARGYRYSSTQRDGSPWHELPETWSRLATEVAGEHPWDSCIINWYDSDASLGWHQDKSEADTTLPIVTVSLGDACSWAVRRDQDSPIQRTRIGSGAVTLLAGETRDYFHSVERIIAEPLLSPLGASRGRISVTIRVAGDPENAAT